MITKKPGPKKGQKHSQIKRSAFGERLFKIRKARGITQQELGEKIGVTKRVIASYESTKNSPSPDIIKKIAKILNVTTSHILGESPLKTIKSDIKPSVRKYVDALQKLPPKDQKAIFHMIELAIKNDNK
jgi:transcriptional regulator with XRE-family HTH domain